MKMHGGHARSIPPIPPAIGDPFCMAGVNRGVGLNIIFKIREMNYRKL
jgi:hypothetical protein